MIDHPYNASNNSHMTTRIQKPVNSPRKRPSQARSQTVFDAILEASARILEDEGMEALNTNHIAGRAGISVGSLYQYFPNRRSILAELTRRERAAFRSALETQEKAATLKDLVSTLVWTGVDHQLHRPALSRALDYAEPDLGLEAETETFTDDLRQLIEARLSEFGLRLHERNVQDILALSKGMIDTAGLAGETDKAALHARVCAAVMGYLKADLFV